MQSQRTHRKSILGFRGSDDQIRHIAIATQNMPNITS